MEYSDEMEQMSYIVLNAGKAYHNSDWNFRNVCSPFMRLYYVTKGRARIRFSDYIQEVRPGYMYVIPAFTPHGYECDGEFIHYYIHVYNEMEYNINDNWLLPNETDTLHGDCNLFERILALNPGRELQKPDPKFYDNTSMLCHNVMEYKHLPFSSQLECRGIIYILLSRFIEKSQPRFANKDSRVEKSLRYIKMNLHSSIDLSDLADMSCMSKDHFIRIFKKETGMTPQSYICKKKMEKAQVRLLTESISVKEIAIQLGFYDQSYFCRTFKTYTGMTPGEYRNSYE